MKKSIFAICLSSSLLFSGCFGSYEASNNYREWSKELGGWDTLGGRFLSNLWMYTIGGIGWAIIGLGDTLIFNVIEFWSGDHPMALKDGDEQVQIIEKNNKTYEMRVTKNKMKIKVLKGENEGEEVMIVYKPKKKTIYLYKENGQRIKLSSFEDGFYHVYVPNQEPIKIDAKLSITDGLALINGDNKCHTDQYDLAKMD